MGNTTHISGSTKLIGLIGSPVQHSASPKIHNASFEKLGRNYAYIAFDVDNVRLCDTVRGMAAMGFLGYNITTPCKTFIAPYLDEVSEVAEIMGSVNTVVIQNGRSLGDNTDGAAFMRDLVFHGVNIRNKKITVLGAGGAGSAIITQAALDGVAEIDVFNQNDSFYHSGLELIERVREHVPNCSISFYPLEDEKQLRTSLDESALVVNATSVGSVEIPGCLLTVDMLHKDLIVSDAIYTPAKTELIKMAESNGNRTIDGVGMFLQQAAISERLWVGDIMPIDYIREKFFTE